MALFGLVSQCISRAQHTIPKLPVLETTENNFGYAINYVSAWTNGIIVVIWRLLFVGCRNSLSIHNHPLRRLQLALWRPAGGFRTRGTRGSVAKSDVNTIIPGYKESSTTVGPRRLNHLRTLTSTEVGIYSPIIPRESRFGKSTSWNELMTESRSVSACEFRSQKARYERAKYEKAKYE